MTISEMVQESHDRSRRKGWWDGVADPLTEVPLKLVLMHGEVSKALECYRTWRMNTTMEDDEKPTGFAIKLADLVIRVGDLAGALGIDLEGAIKAKSAYNEMRPFHHGGKPF